MPIDEPASLLYPPIPRGNRPPGRPHRLGMTDTNQRRYTVVIRTYNRREQVGECVTSVLGQTRRPEQVIVVDDGSHDGTAEHLRTLFPDVLVVEQRNLGRSVAANNGIALAEHEWVCLLDDDDLWHRDKLAAVDRYLEAHPDCSALNHPVWFFTSDAARRSTPFGFGIDFVASNLAECHAASVDRVSQNDSSYLDIRGNSYRMLLLKNAGAYSASVVRRNVLIQAGGVPPSFSCSEDWLLFLNVARIVEWHTLPERLAFYRVHDSQSSADATNGIPILAAHLAVWLGGRPFPDYLSPTAVADELRSRQEVYRALVQSLLWGAIRGRRWQLARDINQLGRPLVVGGRNWLYVHLPPRLTSRLSRR